MSQSHSHESQPAERQRFATTRWSVVLAAGHESAPGAEEALAELCRTYWYPLYAYVRRRGYSYDDAQDLTQEFFARLIEKKYLGMVDRERGKFRSFLLASFQHFLANEWDRAQAQKRGGGMTFLSLEAETAESRYALEPVDETTPETLYERRWALTLLDQTLSRLRQHYEEKGQEELFEQLKFSLTGDTGAAYAELAERLGLTEGAIKVDVSRMRQRYRTLLREEIAHTVTTTEEVDEELLHLQAALSR